ncbi:hypothetical protein BV96_02298 [Sphingomonas paucimobilis]|nr:hypothetical protein BV96_02298 [Sphingomonas paucimobilis]
MTQLRCLMAIDGLQQPAGGLEHLFRRGVLIAECEQILLAHSVTRQPVKRLSGQGLPRIEKQGLRARLRFHPEPEFSRRQAARAFQLRVIESIKEAAKVVRHCHHSACCNPAAKIKRYARSSFFKRFGLGELIQMPPQHHARLVAGEAHLAKIVPPVGLDQ